MTQLILSLRRLWSRVRLYLLEVETKRTVSVFMVCLNINTKATSNGLAVRMFPATMRTFTKDTELSEHSRGTALYVGISLYTSVYFNIYVPRKRTGRQTAGCSYESSISFIIVWACAFRTIISNQWPWPVLDIVSPSNYSLDCWHHSLTKKSINCWYPKRLLSFPCPLDNVQPSACCAPPLSHITCITTKSNIYLLQLSSVTLTYSDFSHFNTLRAGDADLRF